MNFQKKLFSFFIVVSFVLGFDTIDAQETNISHEANEGLIAESRDERILPDPYKEYLENLPLSHKIWNAIGASNFGYGLRSIGRSLPSNPYQLPGPVVEEFHDLLKEAQTVVGLSKERHLPAGLLNPEKIKAAAVAMPSAIIFNEIHLHGRSYGYKRFVVFHEAVHAKYDHLHPIVKSLIGVVGGVGASIAAIGIARVLIPPIKNKYLNTAVHLTTGAIVGHLAGFGLVKKLEGLAETRADTEGAFASRCGQCVSEHGSVSEHDVERGYLTCSELDAIADKLWVYSCEYHKN